jgi:phasin family protein
MSKQAANPFFEVDFSKFADFSKLAGDFKAPVNMEPFFAACRRNIEACTAVNQAALECFQSLARRQADWMRQGVEEATTTMSALMSCPPEEKVIKQAEASKAAVEKCLANCRDISETISRCNTQAMETVMSRMSESVEELRGMMKSRQDKAA